MDRTRTSGIQPNRLERTLAHLKILSRLLGHELHAQNAPRLTLSRDEVVEIQTSIDLYIEEILKTRSGGGAGGYSGGSSMELEVQAVPARVN